jgi:hypothetical protein
MLFIEARSANMACQKDGAPLAGLDSKGNRLAQLQGTRLLILAAQ